jgi:hypothetical protein
MLPHYVISPPCRVFSTATDPSGHYVVDEILFGDWAISFYTTPAHTTNLIATLPTICVPIGITRARILLYLHNPQSSAITTIFAGIVQTPTATGAAPVGTPFATVNIPANTTVVVDLGVISFEPSTTLSHYRSHPFVFRIMRRKQAEQPNGNKVICRGVAIVPQR